MMQFQVIKSAIAAAIQTQAAGAFELVTSNRQAADAERLRTLPHVRLYMHEIQFDPQRSARVGRKVSQVTLHIDLFAAAGSSASVETLQGANDTAVKTALLSMTNAADAADAAYDNLVSTLWNILENPANHTWGLDPGTVSDFWIDTVQKGTVAQEGNLVVISGSMDCTFKCTEYPPSAVGIPLNGIDTKLAATIDATADPKTVGFNPAITEDPKFLTAELGAKVGT